MAANAEARTRPESFAYQLEQSVQTDSMGIHINDVDDFLSVD
jgi:hypothetical protein